VLERPQPNGRGAPPRGIGMTMTLAEAARLYEVSPNTLRVAACRGILPARTSGVPGHRGGRPPSLVETEDVEAYLRSRRNHQPAVVLSLADREVVAASSGSAASAAARYGVTANY